MVDVGPQRGVKTSANDGTPLRPIMKQIPAGIHFWLVMNGLPTNSLPCNLPCWYLKFAFSRRQKQPHGPGTELLAELQMARISPVNLPGPSLCLAVTSQPI